MRKKIFIFFLIMPLLVFIPFMGFSDKLIPVQAFDQTAMPICTVEEDQQNPFMVKNIYGGIVIIWEDNRNGNYDIYAQKIDSRGNPLWDINGIPVCTAPNDQGLAIALADNLGGVVIIWLDSRSGTNLDIYAQRVDFNGTAMWGTDGIPISNLSGDQHHFDAFHEEYTDEILVVWTDERNGAANSDIYGQRIAMNGTFLWNNEGQVICNATGRQLNPKIVPDNWGGAYVCWRDLRSGSDWEDTDLYISRIFPTGEYRWIENGIILCDAPDEQTDINMINGYPESAIVVWRDYRNGYLEFYTQHVDRFMNRLWGPNGKPIENTNKGKASLMLCSDGNYGAYVAWSSETVNGSGVYDIYAQIVNVSGVEQLSPNGSLICNAENSQFSLNMVEDGIGGAILMWQDRRSPSENAIYVQRIQSDGSTLWGGNGTAIDPYPNVDQDDGDVVLVQPGEAIFAWADERDTGTLDIWAQYYKDETFPTCTSPEDISVIQGDSATISWNLYDNAGNGGYFRVRMGIPEQIGATEIVPWTKWEQGDKVYAPIDSSINGTFWYRIEFNDTFGNMNQDIVNVNITLAPPSNGLKWIYWVIPAAAVVAIGTVIGVLIVVRKRKEVGKNEK